MGNEGLTLDLFMVKFGKDMGGKRPPFTPYKANMDSLRTQVGEIFKAVSAVSHGIQAINWGFKKCFQDIDRRTVADPNSGLPRAFPEAFHTYRMDAKKRIIRELLEVTELIRQCEKDCLEIPTKDLWERLIIRNHNKMISTEDEQATLASQQFEAITELKGKVSCLY
jgi:hypothetical protein